MTDDERKAIRKFTSVAPVAVTYTFDRTPYLGGRVEVVEIERVVHRSSSRSHGGDDGLGFVGGFVMGSMF